VLWVVDGRVLLRQRKSADESPKVADAAVVQQAPPKTKKPASFGGPRCKDNVVILYGFTKVTPDDYDFPLTRKALKGHTELKDVKFVVTKDYGKKFFAAKTPSFDVAKKVSKVIEDGVKGAKPANRLRSARGRPRAEDQPRHRRRREVRLETAQVCS
jgi:hypothetical protein